MIVDIVEIIKIMEDTLKNNSFTRSTALDQLQEQENGEPFKILIGTILSSRTRDEQTTVAVTKLFSKYKNSEEIAKADVEDIKSAISSVGFHNVKAQRIKDVSDIIHKQHKGKTPDNIEELLALPGVGRKTANCVLVYGFKIPAIPVDTHVHRIFNRIGIFKTKDPMITEEMLSKSLDKNYWIKLNSVVVRYGQNICRPIKPLCNQCILAKNCKYFKEKVKV